ncbi:MarR family winged helix-turn-helix transcriptional regulator [Glutamicibacter sp. BSL13]
MNTNLAAAAEPAREDLGPAATGDDFSHRFEALEHQLVQLMVNNAHAKRNLAAKFGDQLPPAALPVLSLVMNNDQIAQSELCSQLMIDKASLSRLVTRMEEGGLLVRSLDPEDRRVSRLSATDAARDRWRSLMGEHRSRWRSRVNEWPREDVDRLVGLLDRLNVDLRDI